MALLRVVEEDGGYSGGVLVASVLPDMFSEALSFVSITLDLSRSAFLVSASVFKSDTFKTAIGGPMVISML
jgi:hypothetical protein